MPPRDPPLPTVITRAAAVAAGMTTQQVARRVRSGRWRRLRAGVYCRCDDWEVADPRRRHLYLALAALEATDSGQVLSHASAAALHRLPLPRRGSAVWMTREGPGTPAYHLGLRVLVAPLPDQDLSRRFGARSTGLARTVADCLRHLDEADAVAVGDAALRATPLIGPRLLEVLDRCSGWPYAARGTARLDLLDGRRESPLESASAVAMHRGHVPAPEAQAVVYDGRGFIGRSDFWWPEFGVLGEADGLAKYGALAGDDLDAARRALQQEKRREDRLRSTDARVVRWGWSDLDAPGWARWLLSELARGHPSRFSGRVVLRPTLGVRRHPQE